MEVDGQASNEENVPPRSAPVPGILPAVLQKRSAG